MPSTLYPMSIYQNGRGNHTVKLNQSLIPYKLHENQTIKMVKTMLKFYMDLLL